MGAHPKLQAIAGPHGDGAAVLVAVDGHRLRACAEHISGDRTWADAAQGSRTPCVHALPWWHPRMASCGRQELAWLRAIRLAWISAMLPIGEPAEPEKTYVEKSTTQTKMMVECR